MNDLKRYDSAYEKYFNHLSVDKNDFNDYIKNSFISNLKVKINFTLNVRDGDD